MPADLPWWAWAQALVIAIPIASMTIWWDWRENRKRLKALDEATAVFSEWTRLTVRCPACQGSGRVPKFEIRKVV